MTGPCGEGMAAPMVIAGVTATTLGNRFADGGLILLLGLGGFAWALTRSTEQMHERLGRSVQPVSRLIGKVPGAGAKYLFAAVCLGMAALGVVTLAGG